MTETHGGLSAIRRQIMWNRLLAVVEEQAQTLLRTAFSPIVRESGDLSAGVFDLQGNMLAQAVTGTPGHVNSMAESVRHFIEAFPTQSMAEGDVYCTNNPWKGTGHLNDLVVTTPAFHRGRLIGLFSCTSHIVDLGGIGFGPDGTDVFMEGLSLPFLKLVDRGRVNETLMAIVKANTRLPVETEGDIYSLINCNEIGARRLDEMMTEFGLATLEDLSGHILESSRAAVLAEIAKLPRGSWRYEMTIDGYDEPLVLAATTTIAEDEVRVDFTGTSPAARFGINSPLAYTTAYSVFGLACAIAPRVPNNAGSLSPYHVGAPAHTIVTALAPAPVASRHLIGQMLPDVVFGCLRQAIPDRVPAEGASCIYLMTFRSRDAEAANRFAISVVTNGGTGARPGKDGLSATDRRDHHAAALLAQRVPRRFRRGGHPSRRPWAGARDREPLGRCHRDPRRLRPHEIPAARARRWPGGQGSISRAEIDGPAPRGQGAAGDSTGRTPATPHRRRRGHRRCPAARGERNRG